MPVEIENETYVPLKYTEDVTMLRKRVRKQVEDCPPNMAVVEILRNAIQAPGATNVHILRRLWPIRTADATMIAEAKKRGYEVRESLNILEDPEILIPKLSVRNDGVGIDADKLARITALGQSEEKDDGHGIGGKVAGLSYSPFGLLFLSQFQQEFHGVNLFRGEDASGSFYGRRIHRGEDVWEATEEVNALISAENSVQERIDLLTSTDDWTEVLFLGDHILEDTTKMLERPRKVQYWVGNVIYDRFFRLPKTCAVYIDKAIVHNNRSSEFGNKNPFKRVKTIAEADFYSNYASTTIDESGKATHSPIVDKETGIKLHFFHDSSTQSHSIIGEGTSFFTVVYKNEMFCTERYGNYSENRKWGRFCLNFGISTSVVKNLSLAIELPDTYNVRNDDYRIKLLYNNRDRTPFDPKDVAAVVKRNIPAWLTKLMDSQVTTDDIESLQKYMNDQWADALNEIAPSVAKQPPIIMESKHGKTMARPDENQDPINLDDYRKSNGKSGKKNPSGGEGKPDSGVPLDANSKDLSKPLVAGKLKSYTLGPPTSKILLDPEEIKAAGLKEYIAAYDQGVFTVNGLHPLFNDLADRIISKTYSDVDYQSIHDLVYPASRNVIVGYIIRFIVGMRAESRKPDFRDMYLTSVSPQMITNTVRGTLHVLFDPAQRLAGSGFNSSKIKALRGADDSPKSAEPELKQAAI